MTYEEYKNNKNHKIKRSFINKLLDKLFTIIIFSLIVLIISNKSVKFRNFIKNDVLDCTLDFSIMNNITNKITNVFKSEISVPVSKEIKKQEPYLDGIKYIIGENENILIKDSGIVTKIENKEGYGNTIIIQQSNGYYAWYGNVSPTVKLYDYIESGNIIGTSSYEYYYVLLKDDKAVTLDEN